MAPEATPSRRGRGLQQLPLHPQPLPPGHTPAGCPPGPLSPLPYTSASFAPVPGPRGKRGGGTRSWREGCTKGGRLEGSWGWGQLLEGRGQGLGSAASPTGIHSSSCTAVYKFQARSWPPAQTPLFPAPAQPQLQARLRPARKLPALGQSLPAPACPRNLLGTPSAPHNPPRHAASGGGSMGSSPGERIEAALHGPRPTEAPQPHPPHSPLLTLCLAPDRMPGVSIMLMLSKT